MNRPHSPSNSYARRLPGDLPAPRGTGRTAPGSEEQDALYCTKRGEGNRGSIDDIDAIERRGVCRPRVVRAARDVERRVSGHNERILPRDDRCPKREPESHGAAGERPPHLPVFHFPTGLQFFLLVFGKFPQNHHKTI